MKKYVIHRTVWGVAATVETGATEERPLDPRFDLVRHSPDGFEFGYSGSGPSQLALAICADALGDDERALSVYQRFKERFVAAQMALTWVITERDVIAFADALTEARTA